MVNPETAEVINALDEREPRTESQVCEHLAELYESSQAELRSAVQGSWALLTEAGLVRSLAAPAGQP